MIWQQFCYRCNPANLRAVTFKIAKTAEEHGRGQCAFMFVDLENSYVVLKVGCQ